MKKEHNSKFLGKNSKIIISLSFLFLLNLVSIITMAISKIGFSHVIWFIALSVLSLLTSIYFYFSNPRQKYTVIGHLVFDLLLLFFIFIIGYQYYSTYYQTVMTNTAFIVFTVSEVVEIIIPDIVAFEYRNSTRYVKKGLVFICLTISLFVFLIYSSIIFTNGVFGQKYNRQIKYQLSDGYYVAESLVEGKNKNVVIPKTFNGKEVKYVSPSILFDKYIKNVTFESDSLELISENKLFDLPSNKINIYCNKESIDYYKDLFYLNANESLSPLGNMLYPINLESDDVYISFYYDTDDLLSSNGQILKTWFGKKGDTFKSNFDSNVNYSIHSNIEDEEVLFKLSELNSCYMDYLVSDSGEKIENKIIDKSLDNVKVELEKVIKFNLVSSNDTKYDISTKKTKYLNKGYYKALNKYTVDEYDTYLKSRKGFKLSYIYDGNTYESLSDIAKLDLPSYDIKLVFDYKDMTLSLSSSNENNQVVYGDSITLSSNIEFMEKADGLSFKYDWSNEHNGITSTSDSCTVLSATPDDCGRIYLECTITSSESSLKKALNKSISIEFLKKDFEISWTELSDDVYSASAKNMSYLYDENNVVAGDNILFKYTNTTPTDMIDAGAYTLSINFVDSKYNDVYNLINNTKSYEIKKKKASITSNSLTKTYDSLSFDTSEFSIDTLGFIEPINELFEVTYTQKALNAGNYTNDFTLVSQDKYKNYDVTISYGELIIHKRDLVIDIDNKTKTYDGLEFLSSDCTYQVSGIQSNDLEFEIFDIQFIGDAIDTIIAGTFEIDYSLTKNAKYNNYKITVNKGSLVINKRDLEITYTSNAKTYDAHPFSEIKYTITGLASTDTETDIFKNMVDDSYKEVVDVGTYSFKHGIEKGIKFDNYNVTVNEGTFTINKKDIEIRLKPKTMEYSNTAYQNFEYDVIGLASKDKLSDVYTLSDLGSAVGAKDVGEYIISLNATNNAKAKNYNLTITPSTLTITKKNLTITFDNKVKTYDNSSLSSNYFTYNVVGLVGGDTLSNVLSINVNQATFNNIIPGEYAISYSVQENAKYSNYNVTINDGTLTINKRNLTINVLDKTKTYDGMPFSASSCDINVSGLAQGDSIEDVISYTFTGNAINAVNAGTYSINLDTVNGIKALSYNITIVKGTLTINKRNLTITIDDKEKTYDGLPIDVFTFDAQNLASTDVISDVITDPIYSTKDIVDVGTYDIKLVSYTKASKFSNYNINVIKGTLTIVSAGE